MLYCANSSYLSSSLARSAVKCTLTVHLYSSSLMSSRPVALPALVLQAHCTETESNGLLKPGSQAGSAAAHQIINQ